MDIKDMVYTIWEDGIPMEFNVSFEEMEMFLREIMPYTIGDSVYMIQVFTKNTHILRATYEYFFMDGKIWVTGNKEDVPPHRKMTFGTASL